MIQELLIDFHLWGKLILSGNGTKVESIGKKVEEVELAESTWKEIHSGTGFQKENKQGVIHSMIDAH